MKPYSRVVHWVILFLFICSLPAVFWSTFQTPERPEASAGTTFTEDFANELKIDGFATTAKLNVGGSPVSIPLSSDKETLYGKDNLFFKIKNHAAVITPGKKVYIFGGQIDGIANRSIYKYDLNGTGNKLTKVSTAWLDKNPVALETTTAVYSSAQNKIFVFFSSSIYEFNVANETIKDTGVSTGVLDPQVAISSGENPLIYIAGGRYQMLPNSYYSCQGTCASGMIRSFNPNTYEVTRLVGEYPDTVTELWYGSWSTSSYHGFGGFASYYENSGTKYLLLFSGNENADSTLVYNTNPSKNLWVYNITNGTGPEKYANILPESRSRMSGIFAKNNKYYLYGGDSGFDPGTTYSTVWEFDPSSFSTSASALNVSIPMRLSAPVVYDADSNTSYIVGGRNDIITDVLNNIRVSNPAEIVYKHVNVGSLDSGPVETITASAAGNLSAPSLTFTQNNNGGYVFGALDDASYHTLIKKYDFNTEEFSTIGTLPSSNYGMGVSEKNGTFYIFGGEENSKQILTFREGDQTATAFSGSSLAYDCRYCTTVPAQNKVYLFSVKNETTSYVQDFNMDDGTVTSHGEIAMGYITYAALASDGLIYLIGGTDGRTVKTYNLGTGAISVISTKIPTSASSSSCHNCFVQVGDSLYSTYNKVYKISLASNPSASGGSFNYFDMGFSLKGFAATGTQFVKDNIVYELKNGNSPQKFSIHYSDSATVQSKRISSGPALIGEVKLTATDTVPTGTSIDYYLSVNGGTNWTKTSSGQSIYFSVPYWDVRWKAELHASADSATTPTINNIKVEYFGSASHLSVVSPKTTPSGWGLATEGVQNDGDKPYKIVFKDGSGNQANVSAETVVTLSTYQNHGYFSHHNPATNTCNNDWSTTLDIAVLAGESEKTFCFYGFSTYRTEGGYDFIRASSSSGMGSSLYMVNVPNPLRVPGSTYMDKNSVTVGEDAKINVKLVSDALDAQGQEISRKGSRVSISSDKEESISPVTIDDDSGIASTVLNSTVAGKRIFTFYDETDKVYLPPINFEYLPAVVSRVDASIPDHKITVDKDSTAPESYSVKAGEKFNIATSLHDGFGNFAYNSTDTLVVTSSDKSAVLPGDAKLTVVNETDTTNKTFSDIILKTSGSQTITVTDNETKRSTILNFFVTSSTASSKTSKLQAVKFFGDEKYTDKKGSASDKASLILNKDKLWVEAIINDKYGNPVKGEEVSITLNSDLGSVTETKVVTNEDGSASFIYTPLKEGDDVLVAHDNTSKFDLEDKVTIKILPDTVINQIVDTISDTTSSITKSLASVAGAVAKALQESPTARAVASVAAPIINTVATAGLIPIIANVIGGAPATLHALNYDVSLTLEALGIRKRRKSWGRVFDSTTSKGVDMALVRLYDAKTMSLVTTAVTDVTGRYNFHPGEGEYVMSVSKEGYLFPTSIFAKYSLFKQDKKLQNELTERHYIGQPIKIDQTNPNLNIDVPVDPVKTRAPFFLKIKLYAADIIDLLTFSLSRIFIPTLILGSILSLFTAVALPTDRNITFAVIYFTITLIYIIGRAIKQERYGFVYDKETQKGIAGVVVSVFDKEYNSLKETRVTDKFGRFSISVPKGKYYLIVQKVKYEFTDSKHKDLRREPFTARFGKFKNHYHGQTLEYSKTSYINVSIGGRSK